LNFQHPARSLDLAVLSPAPCRLEAAMNRDPRFALSHELEAKLTLLESHSASACRAVSTLWLSAQPRIALLVNSVP